MRCRHADSSSSSSSLGSSFCSSSAIYRKECSFKEQGAAEEDGQRQQEMDEVAVFHDNQRDRLWCVRIPSIHPMPHGFFHRPFWPIGDENKKTIAWLVSQTFRLTKHRFVYRSNNGWINQEMDRKLKRNSTGRRWTSSSTTTTKPTNRWPDPFPLTHFEISAVP